MRIAAEPHTDSLDSVVIVEAEAEAEAEAESTSTSTSTLETTEGSSPSPPSSPLSMADSTLTLPHASTSPDSKTNLLTPKKKARSILKKFTLVELPDHLRDNDFIHTGYRAYYSFSECMRSVFAIHNETGNIWTHLVGALFFVGCFYCGLSAIPEGAFFLDYLMMSIFLFSAVKCLICSTIFHTLSAHSCFDVYSNVAILDYSGISILIFGSFMVYLNYGLYCHTTLKWVYISILGALCLSGIILPWFPFFRSNKFRKGRALFFVCLGLAAGVFSIHTIFLNGWDAFTSLVSIEFLISEVVLYLLGAYIYTARIPEVWFPGKLDHVFHSHQIWHVMVVLAAYCHYRASISLMHSRLTGDTCS